MRSPQGPTIRVRTDRIAAYMAAAGIRTNEQLAARMGVDKSTVSRMRAPRSGHDVSSRTIGRLLAAFPGTRLNDFFEQVYEEDAA
jgi:hypothetical protein